MAIPAVNATWTTSGPSATFQQVAFGGKDMLELAYRGQVTFVGDGATTAAVINWIDGTQTPFWTPGPPTAVAPKIVIAQMNGGTVATSISIVSVTSITSTSATVNFSAAPANAATCVVSFMVIPY